MNGQATARVTHGNDASDRLARVGVSRNVVDIPIAALARGEFLRVREVNIAHAQVLAQVESPLPPILVHRSTMQVIDGLHRLHAAKSNGRQTIRVRFFEGSAEEAFVLAVEANSEHGLPLTLKDRKAAALRLMVMYPLWSDRRVAAVAGLDHKTVGAIRRRAGGEIPQTSRRLGRDGRVRRLRAPLAPPAPARTSENPVATMRSVPSMMDSLRRDPSLRLSETGRQLLRWLDAAPRTPSESAELAEQLPEHCLNLILELAQQNAETWRRFAARVGDRLDEQSLTIASNS
ncbi:ParB N-terminal domain-containing protein [Nocardia sp. NPDC050712]|uniref:ParB/RepB/Spo0J family partition protein n=1 Tax=Nocardia sp. NPDC050712 TaxID=3155518 RepID=UPI00340429EF